MTKKSLVDELVNLLLCASVADVHDFCLLSMRTCRLIVLLGSGQAAMNPRAIASPSILLPTLVILLVAESRNGHRLEI